jgi:hypothetical protein
MQIKRWFLLVVALLVTATGLYAQDDAQPTDTPGDNVMLRLGTLDGDPLLYLLAQAQIEVLIEDGERIQPGPVVYPDTASLHAALDNGEINLHVTTLADALGIETLPTDTDDLQAIYDTTRVERGIGQDFILSDPTPTNEYVFYIRQTDAIQTWDDFLLSVTEETPVIVPADFVTAVTGPAYFEAVYDLPLQTLTAAQDYWGQYDAFGQTDDFIVVVGRRADPVDRIEAIAGHAVQRIIPQDFPAELYSYVTTRPADLEISRRWFNFFGETNYFFLQAMTDAVLIAIEEFDPSVMGPLERDLVRDALSRFYETSNDASTENDTTATSPPDTIQATADTMMPTDAERPTAVGTAVAQGAPSNTPLPITPAPIEDDPARTDFIGDAEAFVFHPNTVGTNERALVRLELFFRNVFITATPTSPVTRVAVQPVASPPPVSAADLTPEAAKYSEADVFIAPLMQAELECFDGFTNCGPSPIRRMEITRINTFSWSLIPVDDGTSGPRPVQMSLYAVDDDGQRVDDVPIWTYDFSIDVGETGGAVTEDPDSGATGLVLLLLAGVVLVTGGIGAFLIFATRRQTPTVPAGPRPSVFISYKRDVSWGIARTIRDRLQVLGADVFLDVEDIHDGSFGEYIQRNIRQRDFFIPVLAPGTLNSQWVQKEIRYALELDKTIIPVLVNNFNLYGDEVPDDLKVLQEQNAVNLPAEYVEAGIERIAKFIDLQMPDAR